MIMSVILQSDLTSDVMMVADLKFSKEKWCKDEFGVG